MVSGGAQALRVVQALLVALSLPSAMSVRAQALDGAAIRLDIDETSVFLGDSVIIDVQSVGLLDPLDLAPLFIDADLLRETVGTRIGVIDGNVVDVRTRHMELLPRSEGVARFGPLQGETTTGPVSSNRLQVTVKAAIDVDWQPGDDDVRLDLRVSRSEAYVHERIVVDLELRHRYAIADERIALPGFEGLDVLPVFEARRTVEAADADGSDGAAWRLIAWRWLAWPNRPGQIEIGPTDWRGTMIRSRTARGVFERRSEPRGLQVAAAPSDSEDWWLPARNVRLSDAWSKEPTSLTTGEQVVRTLTLEADDVLASQLPRVEPLASRSLSSELLGVTREQTLIGARVSARAEYRFRLTPRSPVPVFLDTVRVAWWDTGARQAREAIVPARRVNIGLPDRADLLSEAASHSSLSERMARRLAAMSGRLPMSDAIAVATAVVLAAGLLFTALSPLGGRARRQRGKRPLPPQ